IGEIMFSDPNIQPESIDYNYSLYPNKGYFPLDIFEYDQAWSVQLNPKKFKEPILSDISIMVKRLSDNKEWVLNAESAFTNNTNLTPNHPFLNVDSLSYGSSYAIIFRPDNYLYLYKPGDRYQVSINGLQLTNGTSAEIEYITEFFQIEKTIPKLS